MRGVVIDTPGQVRVETLPDPTLPGPDGAIIEVRSAAICGSDLHFYEGEYPLQQPVSLGHEAIGTIVEVGTDVRSFSVGDDVIVSAVTGCGSCAGCATSDPVTCVRGPRLFGTGALPGAQAELLAVPAADFQMLHLPDDIDAEEALLLTDNLATGWAGARRSDISPGGTVVVFGLGAVGLCAVRSALILGAGTVFAVDPVEGRRVRAEQLGVTPLRPSALSAILDATDGRGAAAVIDAVGSDVSMADALTYVRPGGTVSVIGVHNLKPFPFPATFSLIRSITLRSTTAPVQRTWPELVPLLQSGRLDVGNIFTDTLPLTDAEAGYAAAASRSAGCIKVALTI